MAATDVATNASFMKMVRSCPDDFSRLEMATGLITGKIAIPVKESCVLGYVTQLMGASLRPVTEVQLGHPDFENGFVLDATVSVVSEMCPHLTTMKIFGCRNLTPKCVGYFTKLPQIQTIVISDCQMWMCDEVIDTIMRNCPHTLKQLTLVHCMLRTDSIQKIWTLCENLESVVVKDVIYGEVVRT